MDNAEKMDKFLEIYILPKLKQEEMENLNRPMTSKEIELVVKNLPILVIKNLTKNKTPGPEAFQGNSTKHLRKN